MSQMPEIQWKGTENLPRLKTLYLNVFLEQVTLKRIGIAYETWYPMTVILVMAVHAIGLMRGNKHSRESMKKTMIIIM